MGSKRAVLVEPRRFEFETADVSPSPTQVLVKIAACGLCNWELNHWKGIITPYPMRLGHEWAGTIIETGREEEIQAGRQGIGLIVTRVCRIFRRGGEYDVRVGG